MRSWLAVVSILLQAAPALALEFEHGAQYDPSRHDRFVPGSYPAAPLPNPGFFLGGPAFDWSGVGWDVARPGKRVALISPRHVLNADHYKIGGEVAFVAADGVVHRYRVIGNVDVSGDVAVATLDRPVAAGIGVFPVAAVAGDEHDGREVLYVGRSPGGTALAVGRTAIEFSASSTNRLNSLLVGGEGVVDRVRGVSGDSGSPSFFDTGDGLVLVGHHVGGSGDQYLGYGPTRDAVDDFVAADGYLLDVWGEGRMGDPATGGLVATRLAPDLAVELGDDGLGGFRLHDFSGLGTRVSVEVEGAGLAVRISADASPGSAVQFAAPADASAVYVEVRSTGATSGRLRVFSDADAGFWLTVRGAGVAPEPAPLALSLDPALQGSAAESETLRYGVSLANADPSGEAPAELALSGTAPPDWLVSVDPATLTLGPGESADAQVYVTPPPGAPAGVYRFQVEARDAVEPAHDASSGGGYEIMEASRTPADTTAPSAPSGLDAEGNHRHSEISWQAASDDVGVVSYEVVRDGEVVGYTDTTRYRDGPFERGRSYRYAVRAYDAAGNASPLSDSIEVVNGQLASSASSDGGDPGGDGGGTGICQPTHAHERGRRCRDAIDNDCDGWIDAADPDC